MQGDRPIGTLEDYTVHYEMDARDMPMPDDLGHFLHWQERRRVTVIAREMLRGKAPRRVLDAGAGSSWLSELLATHGLDVHALDLGLDNIRRASARIQAAGRRVSFINGDLYRLPFDGGVFDCAVTSETLEHLDDPGAALRELARVVRQGGYVIAATPYRERIQYTRCIHCNEPTPVNAHLHSFDEERIGTLMADAGLRVTGIVRFLSRPAERLGLAGFTPFLPHGAWRLLDRAACSVLGRESFMTVRAVRDA